MKTVIMAVTNDTLTDVRVKKMAYSLIERGFDVLLVGRKSDSRIKADTKIKIKRLSVPFKAGALFYLYFNLRLFFFLLFCRKADIIWANDLDTLSACAAASFLRRRPLVYDSHELFTEVPELVQRKFVQNIWLRAERWFIRRASVMITVCRSIADYYSEKYSLNPYVIRNLPYAAIPSDSSCRDELGLPSDKKIVIYQGAVNLGRGIEELISAADLLPELYLIIAGSGDLDADIQRRISQSSAKDRIRFTGRLPYSKLLRYTQSADLGVSLEKNLGLNYYYALPNKLFDYIQARIPVVVSDLPEMERIVREYGVGEIAKDHHPETIADSVRRALNRPEGYYDKALKIAADELVWEKEAVLIDTILRDLFRKA